MYSLEPLGEAHRHEVVDTFNIHVASGCGTFFEEQVSAAFFDLLLRAIGDYPAQAATANGRLAGFSLLRPYHALPAFRRTAEISTFLAPEHMGKGLGALLLMEMENLARLRRIDSLLAAIAADNAVSLRFHGKQGFQPCGRFARIGVKQGNDLDVIWMQKALESGK